MTDQDFQHKHAQPEAASGTGREEQVRLGTAGPAQGAAGSAVDPRLEELRQVSPTLARLAESRAELSPEEWDRFAEELSREINVGNPPRRQTLRDRFSASDHRIIRWLAYLVPAAR